MTVTAIQPPTSRLPLIARIASTPDAQLSASLQYLHSLYLPQVRGAHRRRRDRDGCPPGLLSSYDTNDDDDTRHFQSDAFQRAYAIRWLTALIRVRQELSLSLTATPTDVDAGIHPVDDTDTLVRQAASLLATCAGVAAAGKLHRRFSFESPVRAPAGALQNGIDVPSVTIHVDLTDIPLDNHDYASVGAQTWGGACVLAEMIAERPARFGLGSLTGAQWIPSASRDASQPDMRDRPLRVLELGAGTGLVGLTVAKLLQLFVSHKHPSLTPHPQATIILTDFYPAVLANLQSNIDANFPTVHGDENNADHPTVVRVHSHSLDWSSFSRTQPIFDILSSPFDLVFGADIVYEAQHAVWIRDCLVSLLARPGGSNEDPAFHLVIPLRPTHTSESNTIEVVFGSENCTPEGSQGLVILSRESIICEAYEDERSEGGHANDGIEYAYYRIGWSQ